MLHPWLTFGSPVARPSFASQGWANWRSGRADYHRGIDISVPIGSPIYAIGAGVVKYARPDYAGSDAGNWIGIEHADQLLSRYLHLSKMYVSPGQRVSQGQLIGLSGCTGMCSGPHLHFDIIVPPGRLAEYVALFGKPASGFVSSDFGVKVPAEPLVPIDRYDTDVVAGMSQQGIPSYGQIVREDGSGGNTALVVLSLLALGAAGIYYVRAVKPAWYRRLAS